MTELMKIARDKIKDGLKSCTEGQVHLFRRMYGSPKDIDVRTDINIVVDKMQDSKIEWALEQVSRTIEKNRGKK
jgi:hypothetical protein